MKKYLWKIEQKENTDYDTFDSAVICAATEAGAKRVHPNQSWGDGTRLYSDASDWASSTWASSPDNVTATKIGVADKSIQIGTVICASFNAG